MSNAPAATLPTVIYRQAKERGHTSIDWLESWHSFSFDQYHDPAFHHFGVLRVLNEDRIAAGQGFAPHSHRDMEIVTLVLEGSLAHQDSLGNGSTIHPGEIQRMTAGTGIQHSEFNASHSDACHLLQVWFFPHSKSLTPGYEQQTFDTAGAQGQWQHVVSGNHTPNTVHVNTDMNVYRVFLSPGDTVPFDLGSDRQAWLHVACGDLTLTATQPLSLHAGDGAGIIGQPVTLTCQQAAEVYLFEMATA